MNDQIVIRGARLHNLKNITVAIPKNRLVVFTGLSGSGKSTLGVDILHNEGVRQFMESMGAIMYGLSKPPVDSITGLTPSISIDQRLANHSPRSTVGTQTDVFTYLRVLYARLGQRPCPHCGQAVPPSFDLGDSEISPEPEGASSPQAASAGETFPCPHCSRPVLKMGMEHFSFNKPEGACPTCTGLGFVQQADLGKLVDENKSLPEGAVLGWSKPYLEYNLPNLKAAAKYYGIQYNPDAPVRDQPQALRDLLYYGVDDERFTQHVPGVKPPATTRQGRFEGVATSYLRRYADRITDPDYREKMETSILTQSCPACQGTRLRSEARMVTIQGDTIVDATRRSLVDLDDWLEGLRSVFTPAEMLLAAPILEDLHTRLTRLDEAGAGYLTADRDSPSLSAGEAQRLRLASLLGSSLTGVTYIFDEPTIGLHSRDTHRLINVLRRLRDLGNTVLVIEHDREMILSADWVIDFGPGAGKHGGEVVAAGPPADIPNFERSITGDYLAGRTAIPVPEQRRTPGDKAITIRGAREHNLQNITVTIPLGLLVAVTGVSGSGKSTLIFDVLDRATRQKLYGAAETPGAHSGIDGLDYLDQIITIDQTHIGRIPRSNAATYSDAFTPIREAFAATDDAKRLGLSARHFSFNVTGGRCPRCEGAGTLTVQMHFLPDVQVTCPVCRGKRFTNETLAVHYHGRDISQVLDMTVEEALALFEDVPAARSRLAQLDDVGLGYLQLGQPATMLSGGEAQRVKLAKELGRRTQYRRSKGTTLYLLDEPTTGLHLEDTRRLLGVLQRLVEAGSTVVVVEHNLQVIQSADWIIDLGPEGGAGGGRLVAEGTPEHVAQVEESATGRFLMGLL